MEQAVEQTKKQAQEKQKEIAKNTAKELKKNGIAYEVISKATGLSIQEIEALDIT